MNFLQVISWLGVSLSGSESNSNVTERIDVRGGAIRYSWGMDQLRQNAPPRIGTEVFRLHNYDQSLSPGLNPNVKPGKQAQLSVVDIAAEGFEFMDGADFEFMDGEAFETGAVASLHLFTGETERLKHNAAKGFESVDVNILDMLVRLGDKEISTAFYENIKVNEAITVILDAINWSASARLLDEATVTLDTWGLNQVNAFTAIEILKNTEGAYAYFYCDGSGNFVFKNNDALMTETVSITPQATFGDRINAVVEEYDDRALETVQAVQVTQQEREAQGLDVVWSYEGDLILDPLEEVTLIIENPEPFKNATEPSRVGINAEQLLMPSVPLTSGTFIANVNGTDTAAINWNDSLSTIQAAFDTAAGAGNTIVAGSLVNGLRVQFIGALAAQSIPLITIKSSLNTGTAPATINVLNTTDGANTTYKLFASAPLSSGSFKLRTVNGNVTPSSIPYNANAALIESRLNATPLISPGDVGVSGSGDISTNEQNLEWQGAYAGEYVPTDVVEASSLRTATASTATLIVTETVKGGGPDVVISAGDASFDFPVRTSGADVPLHIVAGASGATLMNLKVRAQIMKVVRTRVVTYPEGASLPDGQIYKPTIHPEIPLVVAQAFVMTLYDRYSVSRPTEKVLIKTDLDDAVALDVLQYQLGYRVNVVGVQNGIDADFHIRHIEHLIDWDAGVLRTALGCEIV